MGISKDDFVRYDEVDCIENYDGSLNQVMKIVCSVAAITCVRWCAEINDDDSFGTIEFYNDSQTEEGEPILTIEPGEAIVIGIVDDAIDISVVEYDDSVRIKKIICDSPLIDLANEGKIGIKNIESVDDFEKVINEFFDVEKIPDDCWACEDRPTCDVFDAWKNEHPDEYAAQKAAYKAGKNKAKEE